MYLNGVYINTFGLCDKMIYRIICFFITHNYQDKSIITESHYFNRDSKMPYKVTYKAWCRRCKRYVYV